MSLRELDPTKFVSALTENKCDPKLGSLVKRHLQDLGLEPSAATYNPEKAHEALRIGIADAFHSLGLDVATDLSIKDTPRRFADMFVGELTKGLNYDFFPKCTAVPNGVHDQVVFVKNIRTVSLCEHHLQTIDGLTHIAYIPNTHVLGLSKFARVTEFFAARPQIQERMTDQIYHALAFVLQTSDVAVVQDAVHFCMRARGVRQPESSTRTNKLGGRFLTNDSLREEFFDAIPL